MNIDLTKIETYEDILTFKTGDLVCDYCEKCIIEYTNRIKLCEGKCCSEALDSWLKNDSVGIRVNRYLKLKRITNENIY